MWVCGSLCTLNQSVDLSAFDGVTKNSSIDVSVVNVLALTERFPGTCQFDVMDSEGSAVIKNGVFVVNASIDMALYSNCQGLNVSLFDSAAG